jgi:surface polysaccharide O-acyltransferase-like enzyme
LQALVIFAVVYVVYRFLVDRRLTEKSCQYYKDRFPPNNALILSIIVLAILTFAVRLKFPVGVWFAGLQLGHFVHYIFSFFVGILARRGDWFNRLDRKQARQWGIVSFIAILLFFPIVFFGGLLENPAYLHMFLGGMHWQAFVTAVWDTVLFIGMTVFLLYLFREYFGKTNHILRSMVRNAYTVYIIHQTILFGMNIFFLSINIPTILKFFIVAFVTVPICFLLSTFIRKIPYAKRVLG